MTARQGVDRQKKGTTVFYCDTPLCGASLVEHHGTSYDEARMARVRAEEAGWYFRQGTFCPECAAPMRYTLGPEGLEDLP